MRTIWNYLEQDKFQIPVIFLKILLFLPGQVLRFRLFYTHYNSCRRQYFSQDDILYLFPQL